MCLQGLFFIVYPLKISMSLFANAFQKINFSSLETIFSYWSQLLFLYLVIMCFVKKAFTKNLNILFILIFFLLIFSLPSFHTHRYIFFTYQYLVIFYCLSLKEKKIKL